MDGGLQLHPVEEHSNQSYLSKFMSIAIHAGMCYSAAVMTQTGYNTTNMSTSYKCRLL